MAKDTQLSSGNPVELRRHFPQREDELLAMFVHLERLQRGTEKAFPNARAFVRPGFDEQRNIARETREKTLT